MKILFSFTHPQVVSILYEFISSAEHKGIHFEECWQPSIWWTLYYFYSYYGSQWGPSTVWLPTFFKMYSFVFGRRKKFIQDWNNL